MLGLFINPEPIATRINAHAERQAKRKSGRRSSRLPPHGGVQNGNDYIIPSKKETAADNTRRSRPCCKHEHDFADFSLQIRAHYTPENEKAALSARLSRKHPKITHHKERRIKTIIGSLFPLSIEKPPGALFPTAHANHDATAEAASRYLQDVSRACSKPQNTRGHNKKRCPYYTRFRCILSTPAVRYSSPRCAIFRTLAPSSTSGMPATLVSTDTMAASAAEDAASAQSTPPSAVLAPITATAACAAVLSALTPAHRAHCMISSFIFPPTVPERRSCRP